MSFALIIAAKLTWAAKATAGAAQSSTQSGFGTKISARLHWVSIYRTWLIKNLRYIRIRHLQRQSTIGERSIGDHFYEGWVVFVRGDCFQGGRLCFNRWRLLVAGLLFRRTDFRLGCHPLSLFHLWLWTEPVKQSSPCRHLKISYSKKRYRVTVIPNKVKTTRLKENICRRTARQLHK